jgi:surface protein
MEFMFSRALFFNGDISNWNTATVTNMGFMFREASAFNHDLSNWDIAAVTNMQYMFHRATSFNQELSWSLKEGVVQTGIFDSSGGSFGFNYDLTIPLDTQPP